MMMTMTLIILTPVPARVIDTEGAKCLEHYIGCTFEMKSRVAMTKLHLTSRGLFLPAKWTGN
jgi:hypothetical protein